MGPAELLFKLRGYVFEEGASKKFLGNEIKRLFWCMAFKSLNYCFHNMHLHELSEDASRNFVRSESFLENKVEQGALELERKLFLCSESTIQPRGPRLLLQPEAKEAHRNVP